MVVGHGGSSFLDLQLSRGRRRDLLEVSRIETSPARYRFAAEVSRRLGEKRTANLKSPWRRISFPAMMAVRQGFTNWMEELKLTNQILRSEFPIAKADELHFRAFPWKIPQMHHPRRRLAYEIF